VYVKVVGARLRVIGDQEFIVLDDLHLLRHNLVWGTGLHFLVLTVIVSLPAGASSPFVALSFRALAPAPTPTRYGLSLIVIAVIGVALT